MYYLCTNTLPSDILLRCLQKKWLYLSLKKKKKWSTNENKCISNFADLFREVLVKMVNFHESRNPLKAIKMNFITFGLGCSLAACL